MPIPPQFRSLTSAAFLLGAAGLMFTLAACGGGASAENTDGNENNTSSASKFDGEYYNEYGRLTISDGELEYQRFAFKCNGGTEVAYDEIIGEGQLSDDETQIIWASDTESLGYPGGGYYSGTTPISLTTAGDTKIITVKGYLDLTSDDQYAQEKTESCSK